MNLPYGFRHPWKWFSQLPVGAVVAAILSLLTYLAVAVLAFFATAKAIQWENLQDWREGCRLFLEHWILGLCVLLGSILVGWKPGEWLRKRVRRSASAEAHSSDLEAAVEEIDSQRRSRRGRDWKRAREQLLKAAEAEVAAALPESRRKAIKANLVLIEPDGRIRVDARSKPGSPIGVVYRPEPHWPVWQSIMQNKTVAYDLSRNEGVDGDSKRPYKSIVATPITKGKRAFGAITVDCTDKGCFRRLEGTVDQILRPYAQLVRLTLEDDAHDMVCPDRYDR